MLVYYVGLTCTYVVGFMQALIKAAEGEVLARFVEQVGVAPRPQTIALLKEKQGPLRRKDVSSNIYPADRSISNSRIAIVPPNPDENLRSRQGPRPRRDKIRANQNLSVLRLNEIQPPYGEKTSLRNVRVRNQLGQLEPGVTDADGDGESSVSTVQDLSEASKSLLGGNSSKTVVDDSNSRPSTSDARRGFLYNCQSMTFPFNLISQTQEAAKATLVQKARDKVAQGDSKAPKNDEIVTITGQPLPPLPDGGISSPEALASRRHLPEDGRSSPWRDRTRSPSPTSRPTSPGVRSHVNSARVRNSYSGLSAASGVDVGGFGAMTMPSMGRSGDAAQLRMHSSSSLTHGPSARPSGSSLHFVRDCEACNTTSSPPRTAAATKSFDNGDGQGSVVALDEHVLPKFPSKRQGCVVWAGEVRFATPAVLHEYLEKCTPEARAHLFRFFKVTIGDLNGLKPARPEPTFRTPLCNPVIDRANQQSVLSITRDVATHKGLGLPADRETFILGGSLTHFDDRLLSLHQGTDWESHGDRLDPNEYHCTHSCHEQNFSVSVSPNYKRGCLSYKVHLQPEGSSSMDVGVRPNSHRTQTSTAGLDVTREHVVQRNFPSPDRHRGVSTTSGSIRGSAFGYAPERLEELRRTSSPSVHEVRHFGLEHTRNARSGDSESFKDLASQSVRHSRRRVSGGGGDNASPSRRRRYIDHGAERSQCSSPAYAGGASSPSIIA